MYRNQNHICGGGSISDVNVDLYSVQLTDAVAYVLLLYSSIML